MTDRHHIIYITSHNSMVINQLISPYCHIYASLNLVSIGSDNGLLPIKHQAIIWTCAGLLSIGHLGTNFGEILIKIKNFVLTKMHLKMLSAQRHPFCPGGRWVNTCLLSEHLWPYLSVMTGRERVAWSKMKITAFNCLSFVHISWMNELCRFYFVSSCNTFHIPYSLNLCWTLVNES